MGVCCLQEVISGTESMRVMCPDLFDQLLTFVEFSVRLPKFGKVDTKAVSVTKGSQVKGVPIIII